TGVQALNPEHPPLVKLVCALPVLGRFPPLDHRTEQMARGETRADDEWAFGQSMLFRPRPTGPLFGGRLPVVLLTAALSLVLYAWARRLFGVGGGLVALLLWALDPTVAAHGHLVTTD